MKKLFSFLTVIILTASFISCRKQEMNTTSLLPIKADTLSAKMDSVFTPLDIEPTQGPGLNRQLVYHAFDASGLVEVSIWADYVDGQHNSVDVSVDADYVLTGGGAKVTGTNNSFSSEGVLTAAFPVNNGTFSTYSARSKDHEVPSYHRLWVYAIGMKLHEATTFADIEPAVIRSQMFIAEATSGVAAHPSGSVSLPGAFIPLSGGARLNWTGAGSLLVSNSLQQPYSNFSWFSQGKDLKYSDPCSVTTYCIGINPTITYFGQLEIQSKIAQKSAPTGKCLLTNSVDPGGYLLSGIGAFGTYNNNKGRYLFAMYPYNSTTAEVGNKDHLYTDIGSLYSWISMVRKQQ